MANIPYTPEDERNTTVTPLSGGATFTGEWARVPDPDVAVSCRSDVAGTLYFDFSNDATNVDSYPVEGFTIEPNTHEYHTATKLYRYFRVRYINGAAAQSAFRLYTYYGAYKNGSIAFNSALATDADSIVARTNSDIEVMKGRIKGECIVGKYGRNGDVDGAEDIWNGGGVYTGFPITTAETIEVASSSASDVAAGIGAQQIRVYYYDENYNMFDSSGEYLYVDIIMNGVTYVSSGVLATRVWRVSVILSGSSQTSVGDITVRWDTTTAVIFAVVPNTFGNTQITNFTIPLGYTGYLKRFSASMEDNTSNSAEMAIKVRSPSTNTFRLLRPFHISTENAFSKDIYGGDRLEALTDIVFRCTAVQNANGIIAVDYEIHLVRN